MQTNSINYRGFNESARELNELELYMALNPHNVLHCIYKPYNVLKLNWVSEIDIVFEGEYLIYSVEPMCIRLGV